jgi:cytochrome c-type biogenesis protein CcmH
MIRRLRALAFALIGLLALLAPACAVEPDEILPDAALEARARTISEGLRCLVCQNQSIDDSHAPLARDLRLLVRERLQAGDSDKAVTAFIVARYGEFVLLRPPFTPATVLLWATPLLLLGLALRLALRQFRLARSAPAASAPDAPLSPEEAQRLQQILGKDA